VLVFWSGVCTGDKNMVAKPRDCLN